MPATKVFPNAGPDGPTLDDVAELIKQNKGVLYVDKKYVQAPVLNRVFPQRL